MNQDPTIARRDLLRGAALLAGGSALGVLPRLAEAVTLTPATPLSIGYWNGASFVAAEGLLYGATALDRIAITVTAVNGGGSPRSRPTRSPQARPASSAIASRCGSPRPMARSSIARSS